MAEPASPGVNLEIDQSLAHGVYCNRVFIHASGFDFTIDFGIAVPGAQAIRIVSRVLMSPQHAQSLHEVLGDIINKYVKEVGKVPEVNVEDEEKRREIGFRPIPLPPPGPPKKKGEKKNGGTS